MEEIFFNSLRSLLDILRKVSKSFKDDLFFPTAPKSFEEQLLNRIKGQRSFILHQQDKIFYQTGLLRSKDRQIRDLKNLLTQKDKEITVLKDRILSLQLRLPLKTNR